MFTASQPDVELFASSLPYSLSNTKLFRRDLIEAHGIRYQQDLSIGSDQPFTLQALLHAKRISILSDYDYYYAVRRRDARNITAKTDHLERLRCTEQIMNLVADAVPAGPNRDAILRRHFMFELSRLLQPDLLRLDREIQQRVCSGVGLMVAEYLTESIADRVDASRRVKFRLAKAGRLDDLLAVDPAGRRSRHRRC